MRVIDNTLRLLREMRRHDEEEEDRRAARAARDDYGYVERPLYRLIKRYYLGKHWRTVVLIMSLAALTGVTVYSYAAAARIIADEIVEVGLIADPDAGVMGFDPAMPGENRLFAFDEPRSRTGWSQQHDDRPGKSDKQKLVILGWLALALVMMELSRHVCSAIVFERSVRLTQMVQFRLRQNVHDKLHALPLVYHDQHSPGRLMTHLFSDMRVIQDSATHLLRNISPNVMAIIVGLVLVLRIDARLALLVVAALPTYAVSYRWFSRYLKAVNRDIREREGMLNAHIANRVSNFNVVKAYRQETGESVSFLRRAKPILELHLVSAILNSSFTIVCSLISGTCVALALWFGAVRCRDGLMSPGELLMFYSATASLFTPVAQLSHQAPIIHRMRAVAVKLMRVLDEPISLDDPAAAATIPDRSCEVKFDRVSMKYPGSERYALSEVQFTLPAGKRMCVMGPSGSGKSTLAKLACRFYDPDVGAVRLNGTDIREFRVADLRRAIGFVNQEPIVFSGTIGDNIRYGSEGAPFRNVITAAQFAQIHDFIERLPARYRSLTHERGLTLSGGQKQRVNLARALLQDPRLLVLDDCTSALDADTEARLLVALKTVLKGRTAILVSHRVSIAMACDFVLMLDDGKVAQFGPPRQLLHADGPFHEVYRQQVEKARMAEEDQNELMTDHASAGA